MKKIIFSLLTVFVLFSCQSEMDIEPEFSNNLGTERMLSADGRSIFEQLYTPFGKDENFLQCTTFDSGIEMHYLFAIGSMMFDRYPLLADFANQLLKIRGYSLKFGKDPSLTGDKSGYYVPYKHYIFLKGYDEINEINLMHEFLHAVQESVLCHNMSSSHKKNIEYEVYVAQDILRCIYNGSIRPSEALGKPSNLIYDYEYEDKIQSLVFKKNTQTEIKELYNSWIKRWNKESGSIIKDFEPKLLYMILDCL